MGGDEGSLPVSEAPNPQGDMVQTRMAPIQAGPPFHSSWTFISKYFRIFHKYLQWAFGQLVVMFETIGQVSKYFCK